MKVKAIRLGYYGDIRRREDDIFECKEAHFSKKWMEKVEEPDQPVEKKPEPSASVDSQVEQPAQEAPAEEVEAV